MNFWFLIKKFRESYNINKFLYVAGAIVLILFIIFIFWWNKEIIINKNGGSSDAEKPKSSIAGLGCDGAGKRPFAVMLAGDSEDRPLLGISQADMVFEMPVAPDGITRYMAVFQCETPKEIGSVRSAREDFIPLAKGIKAVYAHWGGERDSLAMLDGGIIDNINALKYDGNIFYRKKGISPPHNGFTNLDLLTETAKDLKYSLDDQFVGYPHTDKVENRSLSNLADSIDVNYIKPFDAAWTYETTSQTYKRTKNGTAEMDKDNNSQVSASVIILMKTNISFWRDQYMRVSVTGRGDAQIYQGGIVSNVKWKKDALDMSSKLTFTDENGQEVKFLPGKIWVEIVGSDI